MITAQDSSSKDDSASAAFAVSLPSESESLALDLSLFPGASLHTGDIKAYKAIGDKAGITELIAQYDSSSANVVA
jgi:hypothetical protein